MADLETRYYLCDNVKLRRVLLKACISSSANTYRVEAYTREQRAGLRCFSTSASAENLQQQRRSAGIGLGAALAAMLASALFLPLMYSTGQIVYSLLVFAATLCGAWAGGAFGRSQRPAQQNRLLAELKGTQLLLVCKADSQTQTVIKQALARFKEVVSVEQVDTAPTSVDKSTNESTKANKLSDA